MANTFGQKYLDGDVPTRQRINWKSTVFDTGTNIDALDFRTNLTHFYAFGGDVTDSSGNARNGTAVGSPGYGLGVYGQAIVLNGSTQYVTIPYLNLGTALTYECWFYLNGTPSGANLLSFMQTLIRIDQTGVSWWADTGLPNVTASTTISNANWYHLMVTQSNTSYTIYINGVSVGSGTTNSINTTNASNQIGALGGTANLSANIDHVRIYNAALTAAQVKQRYADCHSGMIATCNSTGSGFTSDITYRRNAENTAWEAMMDATNAQTITGAKTFSTSATNFTADLVLANGVPVKTKDSGGTARSAFYMDGSNNLQILNDASGPIYINTDTGAPGTGVSRMFINNAATQGAAGITYYEPLSSGHVDAGLVNALRHDYSRRHYVLNDNNLVSKVNNGVGTYSNDTVRLGGIICTTTTTSGNYQNYYVGSATSGLEMFRRDRKFEIIWLVSVDSTTSVGFEVGLNTASSQTALNTTAAGMSFKFDSATSANWIVRNADGVTQTSTTSSTAVSANTIYQLTMINNKSALKFYVNGVLIATSTTNLNTASTPLYLSQFLITNTTATRTSTNSVDAWTDHS